MFDPLVWLKDNFDKQPTRLRRELAEHLNLHPSNITRIMNGERPIKADELPRIADFFGVPSPLGFAESATPFAPLALAPIHAAASGRNHWLIDRRGRPIDHLPRPSSTPNAQSLFGLYAPDQAAAPRYRMGELIWVDGARPPRIGDDALVIETANGAARAAIGEFRGTQAKSLVLARFKDNSERRLDRANWTPFRLLPRI
jgi:hypothetical protein